MGATRADVFNRGQIMIWVLMWMIHDGECITSGSQEFYTQQACEKGASQMKSFGVLRIGVGDVVKCTPKGERNG